MNHTAIIEYLKEKPACILDYPFGPDVQVFKVEGKMFALLAKRQGSIYLNLKCDPLEAVQLRDVFDAVQPGYHMNKKHWNSVLLDSSLPEGEIHRMIDNSYSLVVKTLTRPVRDSLAARYGI
ncbi:MmcQ/YjbR family DNA-binding protein [Alteromonas aestuariivivens]|uniref:MmcQ/YjbR family DNA-binding protein n=1 Tax=Alteromonas aestuariivivens TaxID=1938339 RepID=A0A3D8M3E9_9ALTE|nr:MmcQ/YjbR family DNA-binding protein [Alteromonas aestuariivivens]RDV24146.1 MmcQ/YjbR family DNA-binding protein [Alteromonas aestuariivivens]